jgi:site-specific DNA-methyltransferase (adenine-specific)
MKMLEPDPLCLLLPEMAPAEFEGFKAGIGEDGQKFPVVVHEGKILDGRHRYRACVELGIEPKIIDFAKVGGGMTPAQYVLAMASHRHMTTSQRAMSAHWLSQKMTASRKVSKSDTAIGKSRDYAALRLSVSSAEVAYAKLVSDSSAELAQEVFLGRITINAALTRIRHKKSMATVTRLKRQANVSMSDCDLRLGDNVEVMAKMPGETARVVFADPPYNCGWTYRNDPDGDSLPDDEYLRTCEAWMRECARLLAHDGSLFVLIDDRWSDHFGMLLRKIGLVRRPTIVCWETFANYNSAETGLSQNARYLHWFTKGDRPLINTVEARVDSERNKIKDARAVDHGRLPPNVWPLTRVTSQDAERCPWLGARGNAPQLPRALPERAILLASNPGDLVIDPFNGNGITGVAALVNDRKYIGIDRDKVGLKQSRDWIAHEFKRLKEKQ